MAGKHSRLSPSSASRWATCTASPSEQDKWPGDDSNEFARRGTCGHQILEDLLTDPSIDPQSYMGRVMSFWIHPESDSDGADWMDVLEAALQDPCLEVLHEVTVDQQLIDDVLTAHDWIVQQATLVGGQIYPEKRVPIGHITGEEGGGGTSDVLIIAGDLLWQVDLKLGYRKVDAYDILVPAHQDLMGVEVPAVIRPNLQTSLYLLGSLEEFDALYGPFNRARMTILQPTVQHVSEWEGSIEEVIEVGAWLRERAEVTRTNPEFAPSEDNCLYCRASGRCEAQTKAALEAALTGFDEVETAAPRPVDPLRLGDQYALIGLVTVWAEAVTERVKEELSAGQPVVRSDGLFYKMVEGKMGARAWRDKDEAEAALKSMRLKHDQMYDYKVISPTSAEALAKVKKPKKGQEPVPPVLGKRQWNRLKTLITQERTAPQIALSTDPRKAISKTDGFEEVQDDPQVVLSENADS